MPNLKRIKDLYITYASIKMLNTLKSVYDYVSDEWKDCSLELVKEICLFNFYKDDLVYLHEENFEIMDDESCNQLFVERNDNQEIELKKGGWMVDCYKFYSRRIKEEILIEFFAEKEFFVMYISNYEESREFKFTRYIHLSIGQYDYSFYGIVGKIFLSRISSLTYCFLLNKNKKLSPFCISMHKSEQKYVLSPNMIYNPHMKIIQKLLDKHFPEVVKGDNVMELQKGNIDVYIPVQFNPIL